MAQTHGWLRGQQAETHDLRTLPGEIQELEVTAASRRGKLGSECTFLRCATLKVDSDPCSAVLRGRRDRWAPTWRSRWALRTSVPGWSSVLLSAWEGS
ncbi:hypothetical protein ATSB10_15010 [Dyella thiooxydans]|uniref:Uncharacterized protein n=1 Tax=Dyella thiooxydans TaxID=445710 RepID=A0A161JD15_9GAMM|nr:hypothetical protein ATSB10_15010 [Dyella thiooxydans]